MILAIVVYVVAGVVVIFIEQRLSRLAHASASATVGWLNANIYTPLLRTAAVLIFIAAAYPVLFGLHTAPPLGSLIKQGDIDALLTAALALSLVLPLIPIVQRLPGAVLTAQGILGCCVLIRWLAAALGAPEPALWMGWMVALQVVGVLIAGRLAAQAIIKLIPGATDGRRANVAAEVGRLASEVPAIALYGWALGRQLVDSAAI